MDLDYIESEFGRAWISNAAARQGVYMPLVYIDINEGYMHDAVLFAQIMYWHMPGQAGKTRLRIEHEGHLWIAKKHGDWYSECRVKTPMVKKALGRLQARGLIHYKIVGFGGRKTPLIRVDWQGFQGLIEASNGHNVSDQLDTMYPTNQTQCIRPNGHNVSDQLDTMYPTNQTQCIRSNTENPPENLSEISQRSSSPPTPPDDDFFYQWEKNFGQVGTHRQSLDEHRKRLGDGKIKDVIRRCSEKGGRSWYYVLKALANEIATGEATAGRDYIPRPEPDDDPTTRDDRARWQAYRQSLMPDQQDRNHWQHVINLLRGAIPQQEGYMLHRCWLVRVENDTIFVVWASQSVLAVLRAQQSYITEILTVMRKKKTQMRFEEGQVLDFAEWRVHPPIQLPQPAPMMV